MGFIWRKRAARFWFPPVRLSARSISLFSIPAITSFKGREPVSGLCGSPPSGGTQSVSGKTVPEKRDTRAVATARSTHMRSSAVFPGQS